MIKREK
jgi:hypothetical protein